MYRRALVVGALASCFRFVANVAAYNIMLPIPLRSPQHRMQHITPLVRSRSLLMAKSEKVDREYWLGEFSTSTGEVIEPYKVLGVKREATTDEIKHAYRTLSRKYHPDGMRFRTILPGNCNNANDVRDHWERIKLSYEILSRPKMRKRYDRNVFMADPGAAVQRAAVDAAVKGAVSVGTNIGKGLLQAGAFALQQITQKPKRQSCTSNTFKERETTDCEFKNPDDLESAFSKGDEGEQVVLLTTSDMGDLIRRKSRVSKITKTNVKAKRTTGTAKGFAKREEDLQ
ncbi:hypothetical protein MPSEU_000897500 [Mayamaea pseudoterrestris]|nr:hypothetical protein MPSEU_000897500 [Mayamaea pseudoterrestris]